MNNLPQTWMTAALSDICERIVDGSHNPPKASLDGYPMLSARNVIGYQIVFDDFRLISISDFEVEDSRTKVGPGDVLLTIVGTIGRTAVVPVGMQPFALQRSVAVLKSRYIDSRYLAYALDVPDRQQWLADNAKGTAQKGIYLKSLGTAEIPIAPANEQTRIVEKLEELLSDLDAGVAELKAAQKKLAQYRQSLLKAAVEGALTADWRKGQVATPSESGAVLLSRILTERRSRWQIRQLAKFQAQGKTPPKDWQAKYPEPVAPDSAELPVLPQGWFYSGLEVFIPSDKSGTKTGPFGSLLMKHEHKKEGVPVIGIENIDRMKFAAGSKIHISVEKALELQDYELFAGDVVISRSGTVGEVCVIPDGLGTARFSTNIMRVRLERNVVRPEYFCLLLNGSPSVLGQIRKLCSGSTRDFLNTEILKSLVFPIPHLSEQDEILSILSAALIEAEQQLAAIQISLKQSAAQRKNILQAAFSGQLVPQDPADEPASALLARIRAERAGQPKLRKTRQTREVL